MVLGRLLCIALVSGAAALSTGTPAKSTKPRPADTDSIDTAALRERVREEFLHAWHGYERYARGHDALKPLSKQPYDWHAESLLMTPVDALDTMILMGLDAEAEATRKQIGETLSFDKDFFVKNFEITIRLLGGLLSAHEMTGDARLLALADDLGRRLLPAFESKTGLPYMYVNLRTGRVRGAETNPAETGTLILEFGTLARHTGKREYHEKAKRALVATFERRSKLGLVGSAIDVETGDWTSTGSHLSGGIDSYYEYLWKCWMLFGDEECRAMWKDSIRPVHRYLADEVDGALWYGEADMTTGQRLATRFGALDAFFPAVLALSGDVRRARRLQESAFGMWTRFGIEPDGFDYRTGELTAPAYHLRPEIVESAYTLHQKTGDEEYLRMGARMFEDFVRHCRTDEAYAALENVATKQQRDSMESFLFAETFKYFYLLFSPPETLRFDDVVFNTEAHPLRRSRRQKGPRSSAAGAARARTPRAA